MFNIHSKTSKSEKIIMAKKRNYRDWTKEELIKEVEALKKQKTYGLVWEKDKTKEIFDYNLNWDGTQSKEDFGDEEGNFLF